MKNGTPPSDTTVSTRSKVPYLEIRKEKMWKEVQYDKKTNSKEILQVDKTKVTEVKRNAFKEARENE